MPETTPLIKAALNLRGGAGFDVYDKTGPLVEYLESAEQFLQEKMQEKKLEKRSVREKIKLAKQVPQKREKAKLEKSKNTERKHEDYLNR